MGKKPVDKNREWEKERRNKLNVGFNNLLKLLPEQDPTKAVSKMEILKRAAEYIKLLQEQNDEIINSKGNDSVFRQEADRLKKRVAFLLLKTKELVEALRNAGVPLPNDKKRKKKRKISVAKEGSSQNDQPKPVTEAIKSVNSSTVEELPEPEEKKKAKCGCDKRKSLNKPLAEVNSSTGPSMPHSSVHATATGVLTTLVPALTVNKTILSSTLGPGTLIFRDGRVVNVPPPTAAMPIVMKPTVTTVAAAPQPPTLILVKKDKLPPIFPKWRDITQTTYANKAPIPAVKTFRLESCPRTKKPRPKKVKTSTEDKIKKPEVTVSTETSSASTCTSVASGDSTIVPGESIESGKRKNAEIDCEHARKVPRTESSADDTDSPQKHSVDSKFNVQEPPRVEKENASPQEIGGKEVHQSSANQEIHGSEIPEDAFTEVMNQSAVAQGINQSAAAGQVCVDEIHRSSSSEEPAQVTPVALREMSRNAVPQEIGRSVVSQDVLQQSVVSQDVLQQSVVSREVQPSSIPHGVQQSFVPHEVQRSAVSHEVQRSAVSHEVQRSAVPHEVQRSAVSHEVQRSAVPRELQRSVVHQEIHQSAASHEVHRSVVRQAINQSAVPHEVQRSAVPPEVQRSAVPHEVQRSAVPHEVQRSAVPHEVQRSAVHQEIHQTAVPHEVQRSAVPHEVQRSAVHQEIHQTAVSHVVQRSAVPHEVQRSAVPHEVQRSAVPHEAQRSVVHQEIHQTAVPLEVQRSVVPHELQRRVVHQETHQTAVPHEGQRSKAPHEVQRSAVPHEVQRSVVHQEIHQTAVLPEMHRSVVHQAINQSAVSHEVQRSVVPHEIQRSVVPHEVQRIAIPHEDQRSVVSREVTRSAAPHGVQRSLTHQSLIPREVQRSVVLHEVQRTSRKTQPSGASLEINSSVAREETLRSTISQEMPHGVNLREPRPHESQTDSDKSVEKEVEPASNPTAPTLKDNSRRDPATSLSYSHIETSFPSFSSPMTSKPVNRELFPMTSTSCSDLQLSSTESFNYQPTNQIFSYNSTYSKNQIYPETTMTKTTPHDNQLYFVPPPPPTLPTSSQSCNFSVNNIANSAAPTFSTSSDYRSHFSHTQAQQNYCSFSNGNMFAPAQTQTYNTVNTDQNYNFNITSRASNDIFPQTFQKPFNVATIASRSLQPNQNPHLYHNSNFLINQQKSFPTTTSSYGNQTNQVSQPKKNVTAASFSVSSIANENLSYSGANNSNIQVSKKNFGMSDITSTTSQPSSYSQNQQTFQNSRSFFTVGHMTDTSAPPLFPTRTYQNGQSCHFSASTPADSLLTDFNQVIGKTSSRTVSSENKTTQCGSDKMEKLYSTNTEGNSFKTSNNLCDRTFPPLDDVRLPSEYSNDLFSSLQVPSGGAHSESISPTAAFLLAFPLVTSKTTDNLTEAEPQDNHASTPTTILQIGNIEPPNSELFQPMEFGKELVSDFLSQDKYGAKRKEKKKPDYNASGYAYPQYLAETLYDPSWNDPQKTKTQQERKKPDKQYDYYNKDKKKKNNKITVNWMAAPEADLISSYPKEIEYPSSSQFSSMEIDNFPDLCLTKKNGTYSWSPSKSLLPLDSSALMIPATLPTLVGDLALGTTTPSADSSYRNRCEKKSDKPEDKRIPPKGGNNFLSVSQLVDPKAKKAKPTQQSKKQDKKAKNCPYQKRKDVEPCMYSDNFLPNITWDKQRYKGNYSAESLIGTQQQHHQQQQEMTDTLNFNYQQNSYYYQTSDLGNVESMAPSTGQYSQNSFNFPQSSHLGTLMPEEFPSENFSLNGGSSRTTSQLVDKTRPLNESTPSSYHHHTSSHPQSSSSSSSFTSYHTSSYPPPPPPPRPTGMPSSTTHPPPPPPPPPPVPPIPPPSANVPPPPPPPPPPVPPPSQPNFSHSSTTPSLPNFHVTSNTTTSLTNFNLSTIFPEMNERTTVQGVGAGQQTQLVKHLNPFMNSVPNYRNHAL